MKVYRGAPAAARNYLEADRSRADDCYLVEGSGMARRFTAGPDGPVTELAPLVGDGSEGWVAGLDPGTGQPRGRVRTDAHAVRFVEVTVNGPKSWSLAAELHVEVAAAYEAAQDRAAGQIIRWLAAHGAAHASPWWVTGGNCRRSAAAGYSTSPYRWTDPASRIDLDTVHRFVRTVDGRTVPDTGYAQALAEQVAADRLARLTPAVVVVATLLASKVNCTLSTRERDASAARANVLPRWGTIKIRSVTHSSVQQWINELSTTVQPATVAKTYRVLSQTLGLALRDGRLARTRASVSNCRASCPATAAASRTAKCMPWPMPAVSTA